jgi:hypothetical protein
MEIMMVVVMSRAHIGLTRWAKKTFHKITGRKHENGLLAFDDVRKSLEAVQEKYLGYRAIPLDRIIGSVGRYKDFNAEFEIEEHLDRRRKDALKELMLRDEVLPPVKLYKIGDAYFVLDGNHRIAAAKEIGKEFIDADVTKCVVPIPFQVGDEEPREAILDAEYRLFLQKTKLDKLRPHHTPIEFSTHGRYAVLHQHILEHRYFLGIERSTPVTLEQAVISWYDTIWTPMVLLINKHDILERFPGRTEGDLYIWIMNHRWMLSQKAGVDVGPEEAIRHFCLEGPCPA